MVKSREELMEVRKQMFAQMEQRLHESWSSEEDSLFYYHPSEDRIVLSHALFWTMTQLQFFKSKLRKEKFSLLLRQYQEEMLDAFLQDDDCKKRSCSMDYGCITPEYVQRAWGGRVAIEDITQGLTELRKQGFMR